MKTQTQQDYYERVLRVLVYIQQHLDETIELDDLAGVAHFSPYHFHRIFRGMVGESVKEHVRRLRLERAALRLKSSDRPITRIAFEAGFEAHESFTRAFGELFGMSPSKFREARRAAAFPATASAVHYVANGQIDRFTPVKKEQAMDVRIEDVVPMRVAFVRHVGPYVQVGQAWSKLMGWAWPRGLVGPAAKMFGVCHDDPEITPPERLRYDACIPVADQVEPQGEIGVQTIAGGAYAVTTHRGPYEKLGETYARLCGEWVPASGRELRAAPCLELYRNNPQTTPPDELLTDIYMPVE